MQEAYHSPILDYADRTFSAAELGIALATTLVIGGQPRAIDDLPPGCAIYADAGIVAPAGVDLRRLHGWPRPFDFSEAPRACFTPNGDLLMMCVTGRGHQWGRTQKFNEIVAYRSSDNGATWSGPTAPWVADYCEHAFNPLIPRGGKRIVAFMTDFHPDFIRLPHTGMLGIRTSEDDGLSWSDVRRVSPANDPDMRGVYHMQGCETDSGAWLLGTYTIATPRTGGPMERIDHQYVLRSEDRGESWQLLPGPRPSGWRLEPWQRMLEGRILNAGGGEYLMLTRTPEGHLWQLRSSDDGRSWSDPAPTPLVHPDSPPMVWLLSDGETLLTLIHNKPGGNLQSRDELWSSLSRDRGRTWSEPRFLLANAARPCAPESMPFLATQPPEVCYADVVVRDGLLHIFYNHAKRHVHYLRLPESRLPALPTRAELT